MSQEDLFCNRNSLIILAMVTSHTSFNIHCNKSVILYRSYGLIREAIIKFRFDVHGVFHFIF